MAAGYGTYGEFGERLIRYIDESGRSQAAVAKILKVHRTALYKWLNETNQIPFNSLLALCDLLEVYEDERIELFELAGYKVSSLLQSRESSLIREIIRSNDGEVKTFEKTGVTREDLERFIENPDEPEYARLAALNAYINDGGSNRDLFNSLAVDISPTVRIGMLYRVHKNPNPDINVMVDSELLELLMQNEVNDVAVEAVRAARYLATSGKVPLEVLTAASASRHWLVRKTAIKAFTDIGEPQLVYLLHEFRKTSYHISQRLIRDFIRERWEDFTSSQKKVAIETLEGLLSAKFATSKTKEQTEELLTTLTDK